LIFLTNAAVLDISSCLRANTW